MQPTRKEDRELVQAILGGEMRNAWQPAERGESPDLRPSKRSLRKPSRSFLTNYDRIFKKDS